MCVCVEQECHTMAFRFQLQLKQGVANDKCLNLEHRTSRSIECEQLSKEPCTCTAHVHGSNCLIIPDLL